MSELYEQEDNVFPANILPPDTAGLTVRVRGEPRDHHQTEADYDKTAWPVLDASEQRNLIDLRRTVAFRKGSLIVNTPKSGKLRTIDVPVSLVTRLRELRSIRHAEAAVAGAEASRWLFPSATDSDKPLNDAWFRDRVWRPLLEKAEVRHVRVHDARHTYASLMLRRGVPPPYISRQLGHSSIQVTVDLYGHFIPDADRHHFEDLAEAIEEAATGQNATPAQPAPAAEQQPTA